MKSNFVSTSTRKRYWGDLLVITLGVLGLLVVHFARATQPTTTTLVLSTYSAPWKTPVTLTASVNNGAPVFLGQVTFCDATAASCENSAVVGVAQLTSTGTAVLNLQPGIGTHSYTAMFNGTKSVPASGFATTQTLTVTGEYPTATAISFTGTPGNYNLTALVTGYNLKVGPTGTVLFEDATNADFVLGSGTLGAANLAQAFAPQVTYPAGNPIAPFVATGDFNGDGIPDLVVATGSGYHAVKVLLGNGDGTFQAPKTFTVGSQPYYIAVGDFNNDGNLDLAVANLAGNSVSILLGNGDGTFAAAPEPLLPTGAGSTSPIAIVAADFNGDGILDLAVANDLASGTVGVYLGNGDGTFSAANPAVNAVGTNPTGLTAFYLNGEVNLAVANSGSKNVSVLLGNGDGTFQGQKTYTVDKGPYSVIATDVNNDGIADLVVGNSTANTVGILIGKGDGTFKSEVPYNVGTTPDRLAVSDVDSDGNVDLIVANYGANTISVLLGKGDGTFQSQVTYPVGNQPFAIAIADYNRDGFPDLAVANRADGTVGILLNFNQTATASISSVSIPGSGTGTDQVDASYQGDTNFGASTSSGIPLTTSLQATSLALTANQSSIPVGEPIVLTATLNPSTLGNLTTKGETITFNYASTQGTGSLNSLGVATLALPLTYSAPPVGATAVYPGDANFLTSTSNGLSGTVIPVLTVTALNTSYVSGSSFPSLTYVITGFLPGDTLSAISGTPLLSTTANAASPAGTYPITAALGSLASSKYSFAFENGSLTISPSGSQVFPNIQGRWEFAVTSGDTAAQMGQMGQSTFSTYLLQTSGSSALNNIVTSTTDNVACDTVDDNNVTVAKSSIDPAGNVIVDFTVTLADQSTFDYVFTGVLGIGPPEVITGTYQRTAGGCTQGSLGTSTPGGDGNFTATFFPDLVGTYSGGFDGPDVGSGSAVPATFTLTTNADKSLSGSITITNPSTFTNSSGQACLANPVTITTLPGGYIPQASGGMLELFGTDFTGTSQLFVIAIATNPDGSAAAVGEDDPADGSNGTINDGTNLAYTAFYIISGGPCDGLGGGDAPFKLVTNSAQPPKKDPPRKHHWNPYPRFRRLHRHGSDLAHRR